MSRRTAFRVLLVACALGITLARAAPSEALQQRPDPNSPRYKGLVALGEFFNSEGDASLQAFLDERVAASVRESAGDEALLETLAAMRAEMAGANQRGARPVSRLEVSMMFETADGGEATVSFELDSDDTDRFLRISTPGNRLGE